MDGVKQFVDGQRATWALGDYPRVAAHFAGVADDLVKTARIGSGAKVLDIAAGTGNVAIAAAQAGATVVASDLTPALIDLGREATAGLDVEWLEANAEALPLPDDDFDAATSCFGLIFAPRPDVATAEAFRVVKPGGTVAISTWSIDSYNGRLMQVFGGFLPPPPEGVSSPAQWGDESVARERFARHGDDVRSHRGRVRWSFASLDDAMAFMEETFGAVVAVRSALPQDRYAALIEALADLTREWNSAEDDSVVIDSEYLVVAGTARG